MHFVYLLYNTKLDHFYIGSTNDINRRVREHKSGHNTSTKHMCASWHLAYVEVYKSSKDALLRERKLKAHGSGLVELKKRLTNSIKSIKIKTGEGER